MAEFAAGQRVEADISGTMPDLGAVVTPGTVTGPGNAPGTFMVQTDAPFNGVDVFQLEASRLTARP